MENATKQPDAHDLMPDDVAAAIPALRATEVAFRLPDDHLRELNRVAAERGQSRGRLAKDIVMAALMDFGRFDELGHRLTVVERALEHLIHQLEGLSTMQVGIDQLRASLAMVATRLLVEGANVELADAVAWTKEAFAVEEES